MRVLTAMIALLATMTSAVELASKLDPAEDKMGLTQLLTSAMSKVNPKIMVVPAETEAGEYLNFTYSVRNETTGTDDLKFIDGHYHNTTRRTKEQFYTYMWKHACAFSKWVPTNQLLASGETNWANKDFSRFGFVGMNPVCYWGLIAVLWQKPLPVAQEVAHLEAIHGGLNGTYTHYNGYRGHNVE